MNSKSFASKVLLFGEYTVLEGSYALALPFGKLSGHLSFSGNHNEGFQKWIKYMETNLNSSDLENVDLERFKTDIGNGLGYDSTIPIGYGLGSSGSVTASVFDRYFDVEKYDFEATKSLLAQLESFFHGTSSGLDPLVSFFGQPILTSKKEGIQLLDSDFSEHLKGFHLIDSNRNRSTQTFVNIFKEKMSEKSFATSIKKMAMLNNDLIHDFLDGNVDKEKLRVLSQLQLEIMSPMIPEDIATIWEKGLSENTYTIKLCGAGGGGMFLAFGNIPVMDFKTIAL